MCLVAVVATFGGAVLARSFEDGRPARARGSAEALAMQMAAQSEESPVSLKSLNDRAPASVNEETSRVEGEIGRDPWGQPFHYLILRGSAHKRVVVWSDGANHRGESMESVKKRAQSLSVGENVGTKQAFFFHGDDIGFVIDQ